ncbi:MAG: 3-isopropylmalate dehydratase large subunit [Candidatus Thorarchaeota archaeon]|nr:3-isopropylmalate dehydratase large subunit [Candidatus Thorarchaeota archaeon]
MGLTLAEKILTAHSSDKRAVAGDIVEASVDLLMVHEVLGSRILPILEEMGLERVWDPDRVLVVNDHWAPASDIKSAEIHKRNRRFVREQGITHFCDVDCGICHQVLPELGLVAPGDLVVGSDSHSTAYGAFNAFSTGLAATDCATILATGRCWFRIPETIRIELNGTPGKMIMSKDIILKIIGDMGVEGANYQSIEFHGSVVDRMTVDSRMTMTNMVVEAGAKCGLMPISQNVKAWMTEYAPSRSWTQVEPDSDAEYCERVEIDVGHDIGEPMVAAPHSPANVRPVSELEGTPIDQAFIGSCTNARLEDLEIAARVLRGKRVHEGTRLIVTPASRLTYRRALDRGIISDLHNAGAVVTNPTCGACVGGHLGVLASGEVCISSTNRNFRGRMGSPEAEIYLASPATVAASAVAGAIKDPRSVIA